jgi:hypothetical protein
MPRFNTSQTTIPACSFACLYPCLWWRILIWFHGLGSLPVAPGIIALFCFTCAIGYFRLNACARTTPLLPAPPPYDAISSCCLQDILLPVAFFYLFCHMVRTPAPAERRFGDCRRFIMVS